jgi:hypothetical protein
MTPPAQPLGKGDDLGVESSPSVLRLGDTTRVYYGGFRSCCPEDTTVCLSTTGATGVANRAPIVDAGGDQTIAAGTMAMLDGTVMDDDAPVPLANVQATWSKQSGPGTVTFANANAIDTTATFSLPGTYVLALTASDTALSSMDPVLITVRPAVDAGAGGSGGGGLGGSDSGGGGAGGGGVDGGGASSGASGGAGVGQPDASVDGQPGAPAGGSGGAGSGGAGGVTGGGAGQTDASAGGQAGGGAGAGQGGAGGRGGSSSGCSCDVTSAADGVAGTASAVALLMLLIRRRRHVG